LLSGSGGSLLLGRLHIRLAAATYGADLRGRCGRCFRLRLLCGASPPASALCRRLLCLLLGARALLTLPPGAGTRHLVVRECGKVAADGYVHRAKEGYHLFARDSELAGHVMNTKLAQTCLLSRAR